MCSHLFLKNSEYDVQRALTVIESSKHKKTQPRDNKNLRPNTFLKIKSALMSSGTPDWPILVDPREILPLVKKNPFTTVGQKTNILQEVDESVSVSIIKRSFHKINTEGLPQDENH